MKKLTIYVVRWSKKENCYENSKPCESCITFLKRVGIGTIIYTTGDNDIYKKERVRNLSSKHISSGMKCLNREKRKKLISRIKYL